MTAKLKAKELFEKFKDYCSWGDFEDEQDFINKVKQCTLIAVDEIIEELERCFIHNGYWQEVKKEIEAL